MSCTVETSEYHHQVGARPSLLTPRFAQEQCVGRIYLQDCGHRVCFKGLVGS
jgi:hypothetical protein